MDILVKDLLFNCITRVEYQDCQPLIYSISEQHNFSTLGSTQTRDLYLLVASQSSIAIPSVFAMKEREIRERKKKNRKQ